MKKRNWKASSQREGQLNTELQYNEPWDQVNSDALAWNHFIAGLGIKMQHWSFVPYVFGVNEVGGLRKYDAVDFPISNDPNMIFDNNGIYRYEGDVYVIWQGNSKDLRTLPAGYYPESHATVTINRHYVNTTKLVALSEFDKLIPIIQGDPLEYASVNWESVQHNPTGYDRLSFQAVHVDYLIDANGRFYQPNKDFKLENGFIKWIDGGMRPGFDNDSDEGVIYAIRYRYVPSFYIRYAAHELRSHATIDPNTGEKKPIRGPLTAAIQIDWVFLQSTAEGSPAPHSARKVADGGNTGPR